jgi:hypothetical protein
MRFIKKPKGTVTIKRFHHTRTQGRKDALGYVA